MKTRLLAVSRLLLPVTAAVTLGIASVCRSTEAPKDHHLIVGSDYQVKLKGKILPVVGAGNRTFIVKDDAKTTEMPLRKLPDIQIARGLKLTSLTAKIRKIDATLTSDVLTADQRDADQTAMALTTVAHIQRDQAFGKMADLANTRGAFNSELPDFSGTIKLTIAAIEKELAAASEAYARSETQLLVSSSMHSSFVVRAATAGTASQNEVELTPELGPTSVYLVVAGAKTTKKSEALADEGDTFGRIVDAGGGQSDRFDLTFDISAPQPLPNAYLVLVTEYSAPQHGDEVFRRVLTQDLGTVGPTPRRVQLFQQGFPTGFAVRTYVMSLYSEGQEIATNLSDTKISMTREEAEQYLFADYLASNKGKTLPPAAMLMAPRATLRQVAADPVARQPVYVSVDENGKVVQVSADSRRTIPAPPTVEAALQSFSFMPALKNGVPTAGRARLILAEFAK